MLSILLPTFNCNCVALITELHRQCLASAINFEILVADDASTQKQYVEENKAIEVLSGVTYFVRKKNVGRSAIRNFLVSQSHGDRLLFIDGDLALDNPYFISSYAEAAGDVVVGGITIGGESMKWTGNLRFLYEKYHENNLKSSAKKSLLLRSTNFMVVRSLMKDNPFDETLQEYGYEDVLLGKRFEEAQADIRFINNPVLLCDFDSNKEYLDKVEASLRTLFTLRKELEGYSSLLSLANKIEQFHVDFICKCIFFIIGKSIKHKLQSNKPNLFLFKLYRLLYFIHISKK